MPLLCLLCWQAFSSWRDISQEKKQKRFYQEDQAKQAKYRTAVNGLQKPNKGNTPQEPCGRRVNGICYSHASSPSTFFVDIHWTFPSLKPELFLRGGWGGPCYEPKLHCLLQAIQPQCQALCGHPTSLGSAHTELPDCPLKKRMKWNTLKSPLCSGFPV